MGDQEDIEDAAYWACACLYDGQPEPRWLHCFAFDDANDETRVFAQESLDGPMRWPIRWDIGIAICEDAIPF